jgi:hypothetical protein
MRLGRRYNHSVIASLVASIPFRVNVYSRMSRRVTLSNRFDWSLMDR